MLDIKATDPPFPAFPPFPMPRPTPLERPPVPVFYGPGREDITDRLLKLRRILLGGHLDAAAASDAAGRLLLLDGEGDAPIEVMASCPDGDLLASLALADTIELLRSPVHARAAGAIGGAVLLPFALSTRRLAQEHASFRFAELRPAEPLPSDAERLRRLAEEHAGSVAALHTRLAAATGRDVTDIAEDFRRRRILTAQEAKVEGLVDEILRRRALRAVADEE